MKLNYHTLLHVLVVAISNCRFGLPLILLLSFFLNKYLGAEKTLWLTVRMGIGKGNVDGLVGLCLLSGLWDS